MLQLVTYDEDEWSGDNLMVLRRNAATIDTKMEPVIDFLRDPKALQGTLFSFFVRMRACQFLFG